MVALVSINSTLSLQVHFKFTSSCQLDLTYHFLVVRVSLLLATIETGVYLILHIKDTQPF